MKEWNVNGIVWLLAGEDGTPKTSTFANLRQAKALAKEWKAKGYDASVEEVPIEWQEEQGFWHNCENWVVYRTKEIKRKIDKDTLSLAGEYAVASELCRRQIYAQLTLAKRKRTDLLIETDEGMLRVQVKAKADRKWPLIKGICGDDELLIFVDYQDKVVEDRPDFYILTSADWKNFVSKDGWPAEEISKGTKKLKDGYIPIGIPKEGKGWEGVNIGADEISRHKEKWVRLKPC